MTLKPQNHQLIYIVLILFFAVHVFVAMTANDNYVWDECYYVPAAHDLLNGVASNLEHPFLTKAFMAVPIAVFGDGWFSWRITSILASLAAYFFTYKIAKQHLSEKASLFAVLLLGSSIIFLLVGSSGLLDMPSIAFATAGVYFGLRRRFAVSGLLWGLSLLCKEQALLMGIGFLAYLLFTLDTRKAKRIFNVAVIAGLAMLVFMGGMFAYDLAYRPVVNGYALDNPIKHLALIEAYQFQLNTEVRNPAPDRYFPPVSWVTPFGPNSFSPTAWYWAVYGSTLLVQWASQPNPFIAYFMFPLLAAPLMFWLYRKKVADSLKLVWLWLASAFLPWLAVGFFVRMEGNFYLAYSLPALALGATYFYTQIRSTRLKYCLATAHLAAAYVFLLYWFPYVLFR